MKKIDLKICVSFLILFFYGWSATALDTLVVQGQVTDLNAQPMVGHQVNISVDSIFPGGVPGSFSSVVLTDTGGFYADTFFLPVNTIFYLVNVHVFDCNNVSHHQMQPYAPQTSLVVINFSICANPPPLLCDAGVISVAPLSPGNVQSPVNLYVVNFGTNPILTGDLVAGSVVNGVNPQLMVNSGTILPGDTVLFTFSTVNFLPGTNQLCGFVSLSCDSNPVNDSLCISVFSNPGISIPFSENFDNTNTFYTDSMSVWQHGVPNGNIINAPYSAPHAWVTNLSGSYPNNVNDYLYSPQIDFTGISLSDTVLLSFRHWVAVQNGDICQVEYSNNGGQSWLSLGFLGDPLSMNWYNTVASGQQHFSYSNSGWIHSTYKLVPQLFNGISNVQFRFRFKSNSMGNSEGWAIDDFSLSLSAVGPHVGVTNIDFPQSDTLAGVTIYPTITLTNFNASPVYDVPVELWLDSALVAVDTAFGMLPGNQSMIFTFSDPYIVPSGSYHLCARTNVAGGLPGNIQYCRNLNGLGNGTGYLYGILSTVSGAAGLSEVYLIQHDPVSGTLTALDTTLSIDSAGVTSFYFSNVSPGSYFVKAAMVPGNPGYAASIPTYYQSAWFWNQATPVVIAPGQFTQASVQFVQGINPGGPGFIGGLIALGANKGPGDPVEGAQIMLLDALNGDQPLAVTYSDANGEFGFNNVPLGTYKVYTEMLNKSTIPMMVSLDSNHLVVNGIRISVGNAVISSLGDLTIPAKVKVDPVYPNPASHYCMIPVQLQENLKFWVSVSDLTGRVILQDGFYLPAGTHEIKLETSSLKAGLYLVTLYDTREHRITRKLIIQ